MKKVILTLAAVFAAATMSLNAQAQNEVNGTCGKTVTITATPDEGYEFDQWQDGNKDNPRQIVIDSEAQIWEYTASFKASVKTVIVSVNEASWGSVTGAEQPAAVGATMTLTAVPSSGCYRFKQWSDGNANATRTITVGTNDAANTYQAVFEEVEFTVRAVAGTHGSVSITVE